MDSEAPTEGGDDRAPRRRWRRLARVAIWGLGALAVVVLGAWLVLESDWARETIRQRLEAEIGAALGLDVAIGSLDFDLFPPSAEVERVVLGASSGPDPALAEVDRLAVRAGPGLIRSVVGDAPLVLDSIVVENPRVAVVLFADGSTNLPDLPEADPDEEGGIEVRIGSLDLRGGELQLDERSVPLDFTADRFEASMREIADEELRMEAQSEALRLDLPDGSLEGRLRVTARTEGRALAVDSAELRGEHLDVDLSGTYRDETLAASGTVSADLAVLSSLGFEQEVEGAIELEARLTAEAESWSATTVARSERLGTPDLQVRSLLVEGTLSGTANGWSVDAEATAPETRLADLVVRQIELGIDGTDRQLGVELRRAEIEEGTLEGSLDVPLEDGAEIGVDLALQALDLRSLLDTLDAPVTGPEGRLGGQATYRFTADAPLLGRGEAIVDIVPPASGDIAPAEAGSEASPWSLPLSGSVPITVADGVLRIDAATLSAPGQRLSLAGEIRLEEPAADMRFGLRTEDPRAMLRILPAIYEDDESPLWEPSRGEGTLNGTLFADAEGFRTRIDLELLSTVVTGASVPRIGGDLSIDSAGIQDLHLQLYRDGSSVDVAASVPFGDAVPGFETPDFRVALDMNAWNVGDAEPWIDLDLPFDGLVSGELRIAGTTDAPTGHLTASVSDVSLSGIDLEAQLAGEIRFTPDRVDIGPLRLTAPTGDVEIAGSFDPLDGTVDVRVDSSPLSLSAPPFDDWVAGYLAGVAELSVELAGTVDEPELTASLVGTGLALESRSLGDDGRSRLDVSWTDGRVDVSGSLLGLIETSGGGRLDESADLTIALETDALAEIVELALGQAPEDLDGGFTGAVVVAGPAAEPVIEARFDRVHLSYLDSRLVNLEPVVLVAGERGLRLESLYLAEEGTGSEVFVQGDLGSPDTEMDLRLVSSIDAAWLALYLPDLELRGSLELLAVVRGSPESPAVDGQAKLADGQLILEGFPHAIDAIEGYAFFYPDHVVIDSGRADFASGELLMTGDVTLDPAADWSSELRFQGTDLDLRYPEDWRLRGDARLVLSATPAGSTLSGIVDVETAAFARQFELGFTGLMRLMFQRRPELVEETDDFLVSTRLNIAVDGPDALRVQTNLADLRGDLDFSLRGTMALPVVLGQISLARGGEVGLGGTQYRVERGLLTFANPFRNDPHVDLIASAQVKSYDVRLNVFGPAEDLQTSLSSTPPMSNLDIISLITTGSTDTLGEFGSTAVTETAGAGASAEAFLASQAASFAGQRVGNLLGLDQVQITPLTGGSANLSAARVTVGRRISRDVFVTYSHDPSQSEEGIFELAWQIYPSIALILTRSDDGSVAVDVQWDKTF